MPAYRLTGPFHHGTTFHDQGHVLFPWRVGGPQPEPGTLHLSERPDGWGSRLQVPRDLVEAITQPKWTEFEALARFYLTGWETPPNLELGDANGDLDRDLNALAHSFALGGEVFGGRLSLSPAQRQGEMAMAIMNRTQGGALNGEAIVLRYLPTWGGPANRGPRTARFKLCDHAKAVGAGANPQRGWHPGRCSKCGLDMSVDSGD